MHLAGELAALRARGSAPPGAAVLVAAGLGQGLGRRPVRLAPLLWKTAHGLAEVLGAHRARADPAPPGPLLGEVAGHPLAGDQGSHERPGLWPAGRGQLPCVNPPSWMIALAVDQAVASVFSGCRRKREDEMPTVSNKIDNIIGRVFMSKLSKRIKKDKLTYLSPAKMLRIERAVSKLQRNKIAGDIAEFGVALGGSSLLLASRAKGAGRNFHGYDVFGMIPPPTSDKDDDHSRARYSQIASGASKGIGGDAYYGYESDLYEKVCQTFKRYQLSVDNKTIFLHKGLFIESVPKSNIGTIAFAHIDCDWFDPVEYCLSEVYSRLSGGGCIVLDDYHDYAGCRKATDVFLASHSDLSFDDGANVILWKH
jgi:O-methyltransferase